MVKIEKDQVIMPKALTAENGAKAELIGEFFEEKEYRVLYQDTDSLFVSIEKDEDIPLILEHVNERLKEHLIPEFNLKEYTIELQYEKTFDPLILVDKKRYTGLMKDLDGKAINKIFTRGLETIKKDTIEFTRKLLIELIEMILIQERPIQKIISWLLPIKRVVLEGEFTANQLKITKKLSRPISEYKTKLPHVRLAEKLIKEGKILETQSGKHVWGQKIEYIVLNYKRSFKTEKSNPQEQMDEILASNYKGEFDRNYYWNVQVFGIFKRLLKTVYPEYDWEQYSIKSINKKNINQMSLI